MRTDLLQKISLFSEDFENAKSELNKLLWDSDEIFILKRAHVFSVLNRQRNGQLTLQDIRAWAEAIESREDVEYEESFSDEIKEIIFEAANPEINGDLDSTKIQNWIQKIES